MLSPTPPPPTNQDDQAAVCKSNLQTIPSLQTYLGTCRSTEELQRANSLLADIDDTADILISQISIYNDNILTGDNIFGTSASTSALSEVKARNSDLKTTVKDLKTDIAKYKSIIEQTDRDFVDEKDASPEKIKRNTIHVLDDYTLVVLMFSYVIMALAALFYYIWINNFSVTSIAIGITATVMITLFLMIMAIRFL